MPLLQKHYIEYLKKKKKPCFNLLKSKLVYNLQRCVTHYDICLLKSLDSSFWFLTCKINNSEKKYLRF